MCQTERLAWTGRGPRCTMVTATPAKKQTAGNVNRQQTKPGGVRTRVPKGDTIMGDAHSSGGRELVGSRSRRRSRQAGKRPRAVRVDLTEGEYTELGAAAQRGGLAKGAFAAEAALAAARGAATPR